MARWFMIEIMQFPLDMERARICMDLQQCEEKRENFALIGRS